LDDEKYMKMAIEASRRSVDESEDRAHPRVGAVTANNKVVSAYRGELAAGDHAEFTALEKKLPDDVLVGCDRLLDT